MMRRVTAVILSTATYSATAATSVDCSLRFRGTRPLATRFTSPSCEGEGEKKWGVANPPPPHGPRCQPAPPMQDTQLGSCVIVVPGSWIRHRWLDQSALAWPRRACLPATCFELGRGGWEATPTPTCHPKVGGDTHLSHLLSIHLVCLPLFLPLMTHSYSYDPLLAGLLRFSRVSPVTLV